MKYVVKIFLSVFLKTDISINVFVHHSASFNFKYTFNVMVLRESTRNLLSVEFHKALLGNDSV